VGDAGLEHPARPIRVTTRDYMGLHQSGGSDAGGSGAPDGARGAPEDPELAQVVCAWPGLDSATRAAVLRLVAG